MTKKVDKKDTKKKATSAKASKPATKPAPKKAAKETKPAKKAVKTTKPAAKPAVKEEVKERAQAYHIKKRPDGMWEVKLSKGKTAIKLFKTQQEAIDYTKKLSESTNRSVTLHGRDGKIKKKR